MKTTIIAILFTVLSTNLFAQKVVAVHGTSGVQVFSGADPFTDAYNAASNGDTLYLPGGSMSVPSAFAKSLIIYGAGYHPDSTMATLKTALIGTINLSAGSSNSLFEGIDFLGPITAPFDETLSFINFKRCYFNSQINFPGTAKNITNLSFVECVFIGNIELRNVTNSAFHNCNLENYVRYSYGNIFSNTIFLFNGVNSNASVLRTSDFNTLQNNIFISAGEYIMTTYSTYSCEGNMFYNNLMVTAIPDYGVSAITNNDYLGVAQNNIFINQTGNAFDYSHDYNLQSPAVYLGNDGAEVGIYGGLSPFKAGAKPINPHIQSKNISNQTNSTGQLQIEIQVEAQNE